MQGNILLGIGIFILAFLVWVATGGPSRPATFYSAIFTAPRVSDAREGASVGVGPRVTVSSREEAASAARIQQSIGDIQKTAVSAARFGEPSEYRDIVTLSPITGSLRSDDPDREYVSITVSSRTKDPITLTGWRISSNARGQSLVIPEGVALPRSGRTNSESPIVLFAGDRALVTVGESPVGMSFKENACTGYFDQFQTFTPSLENRCAAPIDDFDRFYIDTGRTLDACRAYIRTVSRCEVPRKQPRSLKDECRSFIDSYLDYNGCVDTHANDATFSGNEWRIYLERRTEFFTEEHDTIKLLDASGKTVDLISY